MDAAAVRQGAVLALLPVEAAVQLRAKPAVVELPRRAEAAVQRRAEAALLPVEAAVQLRAEAAVAELPRRAEAVVAELPRWMEACL